MYPAQIEFLAQFSATTSFYGDTDKICHKCSAVAEMGDRLATIDMDQKSVGVCAPLGEGRWVPI